MYIIAGELVNTIHNFNLVHLVLGEASGIIEQLKWMSNCKVTRM